MLFRPPATYIPDTVGDLIEEFEGMAARGMGRGSYRT